MTVSSNSHLPRTGRGYRHLPACLTSRVKDVGQRDAQRQVPRFVVLADQHLHLVGALAFTPEDRMPEGVAYLQGASRGPVGSAYCRERSHVGGRCCDEQVRRGRRDCELLVVPVEVSSHA